MGDRDIIALFLMQTAPGHKSGGGLRSCLNRSVARGTASIDLTGVAAHKTRESRHARLSYRINVVRRLSGRVSRAAKGADCKSAGYAFVGSSPTSPTIFRSAGATLAGRHSVQLGQDVADRIFRPGMRHEIAVVDVGISRQQRDAATPEMIFKRRTRGHAFLVENGGEFEIVPAR